MFSSFVTETLGFKPTRIDPDVYYRRNYCKNGTPYYEYLLVYVDDVLAFSLDPKAIMEDIGKSFTIKDSNMARQRHIWVLTLRKSSRTMDCMHGVCIANIT